MTERKKAIEPGKFRQLFLALIANISTMSYGMMVGWPSPAIPQLQSESPAVGREPMTDETASWLSGIMCLTAAFITLGIGGLADRYGRKVVGCLAALPCCVGWLLIIFATEQTHLLVARFFCGMGAAAVLFVVPTYVSEISCDAIRGMLGSLLVLILNGGVLFVYVLGALCSFRVVAIVAFTLPLLYLAFFIFVPESPVYLIRRNRLDEAARSLRWLKAGHEPTVEREMLRLQAEAKDLKVSGRSIGPRDLFRDRATIKGLIITLGLFSGQQFCGIFAMISYTETIFGISGSSLSPHVSAVIVGAIQLFGSYLSTSLMERLGRRPLLLISCSGMCVCHYILGTFCYLQSLRYDVTAFNWIPVTALSTFVIMFSLGMGPGPYVVSSEILSRDVSSVIVTLGLFSVWSTAFLVLKFFPNVVAWLGMYGCFFLLGTLCAFTCAFVFALIPETKGLPRQLILDRLSGAPSTLNDTRYVSSSDVIEKAMPPPEQI
ncbi:facilitated trehalose transporter Tret1 [Andrena cerasifolii]|uniref:facilitated trehalose transporter Tret1 n=1 Tax=Andrena cerasifolii TaxID=2819439 RepID=UPI0040378DAF